MSNDVNRLQMIKELKESANKIRKITEEHRKRRPIVIEFSGSPKAGKTSCINSLKQFLKRNGFEVEVIQERASICPVDDKHSPMFNLWTACTTISGMLGVLENKKSICDVLIMDRGIFDALCWFEWLSSQEKMENSLREIIDNFLLINEFMNKIDIVFAFCVEPDISIKREYATLLTDEMGSIMNEKVLTEYLTAIEMTICKKGKYFRCIKKIDTSDKDQDVISKEVTDATLDNLKNLFMEKIGYVEATPNFRNMLLENNIGSIDNILKNNLEILFGLRDLVEKNIDYIQPIPVAVITNKDRSQLLVVKKNNKSVSINSPEKDMHLLYVGGHIRNEDITSGKKQDFLEICRAALHREISEELGISVALENKQPVYIYSNSNIERSLKHLGVCFIIETDTDVLKLRLDSHELVQNKGTSRSGKFIKISEILNANLDIEEWSKSILKYLFKVDIKINPNPQMSIFEVKAIEKNS